MLDKVMGFICMMFGVAALSLEFNKLRQCTSRAVATIIEVERKNYRGVVTYCPVVEFSVDGRMIRGSGGATCSMVRNRYHVGDTKTVLFDPVNPEHFRLRGNYSMILAGLLFLLGGIYVYMR